MDKNREETIEQRVSTEKIIRQLKSSNFVMECQMAFGYGAGLPILQIRNGSLCLCIPYLMHKITGQPDKTLVLPVRYTVTVELPTAKIVEFQNLEYHPAFEKVDFDKPIGFFRHESIQNLNKKQYAQKREELMGLYDKICNALLFDEELTYEEEETFGNLLRLLMEPSLLPIYRQLDRDFYEKYLMSE